MKTMTAALLMSLALVPAVRAQRDVAAVTPPRSAVAAVPFGPGEKLVYEVNAGWLGKRGNAWSEVTGVENVRGRQAYQLSFRLKGGMLGLSLDDKQASWLDVGELYSHRFFQDLNQPRYKRIRTIDFYPSEGLWRQRKCLPNAGCEPEKTGELASDIPLDDVSFLYWARTVPLEIGQTYTFTRYFKDEGNPVVIRVLRRERVTVPAGTFNTIVVKPIIKTDGLFSEGGEAELYFSDDARRIVVLMKTSMPVIGRMEMKLQNYTPGTPLEAR
jgi:hypothetical protein